MASGPFFKADLESGQGIDCMQPDSDDCCLPCSQSLRGRKASYGGNPHMGRAAKTKKQWDMHVEGHVEL